VPPVSTLRERLRAALPVALTQRDAALVSALRATLAALDNAGAVPAGDVPVGSLAIELTPVGVGACEVARRELSDEDVERIVRAEIEERRTAAEVYERAGEQERASQLRHEAGALASVAGF
jgi:uncharacterized protein YqeY